MGLPGAGKTTSAAVLVQRLKALVSIQLPCVPTSTSISASATVSESNTRDAWGLAVRSRGGKPAPPRLASPERAIDVSEFPEKSIFRMDQVRPRIEFAMRLH